MEYQLGGSIDVVDFESVDPVGYTIGKYQVESFIAEGSYGKVYKGFAANDPETLVALKLISKERITRQNPNIEVREIVRRLIRSEASIHRQLDSDYTVRCYDVYQNSLFMIIVQEFCDGGTLREELTRRKTIPERQAVRILKHIILAFSELHRHNIIHRDLKLENIMLNKEKYKIGDFGFAKVLKDINVNSGMTCLGTLSTMAPEIIKRKPYGILADMWSLGVVFYQMLTGKVPYTQVTMKGMAELIECYPLQLDSMSKEAGQLLKKMLEKDPSKRITWKQIHSDPIFSKYAGLVFLAEHKDDAPQELMISAIRIYDNLSGQENKRNPEVKQMVQEFCKTTEKEVEFDRPIISTKNLGTINSVLLKNGGSSLRNQFKEYVQHFTFQAQKSVILYVEFVEPLLHKELGISHSREIAELMHLFCSKSFFIVSRMKAAFERNQNIYNWQYFNEFMKSSYKPSLLKEFVFQYQIISASLKKIGDILYKKQDKIGERITDGLWKIFSEDTYKYKDKMICGLQGKDYTLKEHFEFLKTEYFPELRQTVQEKTKSSDLNLKTKAQAYLYFLDRYKDIIFAEYNPKSNILVNLILNKPKC